MDTYDSTLPPASASEPGGPRAGVEMPGLVVLWSRDEPQRVGEVLLLPAADTGPWTFGRGVALDDERQLSLVRLRPGTMLPTGPLACPRISRVQLRLHATHSGGLSIENVGACPLLRAGAAVERVELAPGEIVLLKNELLLMCIRRTPIAPFSAPALGFPLHEFGKPDAFGLVGESQAIWDLRFQILAIARQHFHVLVLGESGAGKELVAQAIHACSTRSHQRIVARNAATIPEGLADAELFGNVRGYPNPGMPDRPGLIGQAHESTLFLDEFAELSTAMQAHLLRVMDEGEYQRLGDAAPRKSDLRIVAATNRPLSHIKHDILARLKLRIAVPDLNARREDVPLLASHLLQRQANSDPSLRERFAENGGSPRASPGLIEALVQHHYTTHVRELDALLARSLLGCAARRLELTVELKHELRIRPPAHEPFKAFNGLNADEQRRLALLRRHRLSPTACSRDPLYPGNRQTADLHLRLLACRALAHANWDVQRAAVLLAGEDEEQELKDKARARIATFLANLSARLASEPNAEIEQALAGEWKTNVQAVLALVDALRANKISGLHDPVVAPRE